MTEASKLTLSAEELQLVTATGFILTKHKIIDTVNALLGNHAAFAQQYAKQLNLPAAIKQSSPKIAKGENYLQLPWLMLDYPRVFDKENVFAVRTFFWWGNFFSCTLHLSGNYKVMFQEKIIANMDAIQQQLYICINKDEWQHHFETDNFVTADTLTKEDLEKILKEQPFIKLAQKFTLQQWDDIPMLLQQSFVNLFKLLAD